MNKIEKAMIESGIAHKDEYTAKELVTLAKLSGKPMYKVMEYLRFGEGNKKIGR